MAGEREIAAQYVCGPIIGGDDHIEPSRIMQIADSKATGVPLLLEHFTRSRRYILKSGAGVKSNQRRLAIVNAGDRGIDAVVHMPLRNKYILVAIIVEVGYAQPPAAHFRGDLRQSGSATGIGKCSISIVAIQGIALETQIVDQQVEPAVVVVVSCVHSHPRISVAVFIQRNSGESTDFLKGPVAIVMQQHLRPVVVGNKDIRPAVMIIVADINAEALDLQIGETGFGSDVGEMAAAIVVIEG